MEYFPIEGPSTLINRLRELGIVVELNEKRNYEKSTELD